MNLTKITSLGLCPLFIAALAVGACDDKKEDNGAAASASAAASAKPMPSSAASSSPSAAPSGSAAAEEPVNPQEAADEKLAQEEVLQQHRYHHGGISRWIAMAIDTLGIDHDKDKERAEKVDKIQKDLDKASKPIREADKALLTKLADEIEAGKIEHAKIEPEINKLTAAVNQTRLASVEPVVQLHADLNPVERETLIDKVKAHWAVWRDANTEEGKDDKGEKKETKEEKAKEELKRDRGRINRLQKDLNLTDDEVAKIKEGLKAKAEGAEGPVEPKLATDVDAKLDAFAKSFTSDKFEPKTLKEWDAVDPHLVTNGSNRLVRIVEVATPILTPDQRKQWAKDIRDHIKNEDKEEKGDDKKEEKKEKKK